MKTELEKLNREVDEAFAVLALFIKAREFDVHAAMPAVNIARAALVRLLEHEKSLGIE